MSKVGQSSLKWKEDRKRTGKEYPWEAVGLEDLKPARSIPSMKQMISLTVLYIDELGFRDH